MEERREVLIGQIAALDCNANTKDLGGFSLEDLEALLSYKQKMQKNLHKKVLAVDMLVY